MSCSTPPSADAEKLIYHAMGVGRLANFPARQGRKLACWRRLVWPDEISWPEAVPPTNTCCPVSRGCPNLLRAVADCDRKNLHWQ
jgi:hypothetical protein